MIGPTITFSIAGSGAGALLMNRRLKKLLPSCAMKPASRNPIAISFHSIGQSPRKLCATSDQRRSAVSRSRQRQLLAGRVMLVAAVGLERVLAAPGPRAGGLTNSRSSTVISDDHHDPAEVLRERELPADQDPQHEPELPHEVGRGELEGERGGRARALLEQALGDRDRRVGARRGRGAEAGRPRRPGARPSRSATLDALARDPRLHDRRDREAEHERPPDLPRHQERVLEAVPDHVSTSMLNQYTPSG